MDTPEFLLWSLGYRCPIRGLEDGADPERTERQLRAARAASDARREGRILDGLAIDPPNGFRIADALAIYGGESAVELACRECPANAERSESHRLAGCFGCIALPADPGGFHVAIDRAMAGRHVRTSPAWYGLWLGSPVPALQLPWLHQLLSAVAIDDARCQRGIGQFMAACLAASQFRLPLHVRLFPRGRVAGTSWQLAPHCPSCQAPWTQTVRRCGVCNYVGHPAPDRKRRARGPRPYFPLDRLLGTEHAAELLVRYQSFRTPRESPGPLQIPPP